MQRYRDTEIQRDRDTKMQRDRETERQRDRETERQRCRDTEIQRDRETERLKDRETKRQLDRETNIHFTSFGVIKYVFHSLKASNQWSDVFLWQNVNLTVEEVSAFLNHFQSLFKDIFNSFPLKKL